MLFPSSYFKVIKVAAIAKKNDTVKEIITEKNPVRAEFAQITYCRLV